MSKKAAVVRLHFQLINRRPSIFHCGEWKKSGEVDGKHSPTIKSIEWNLSEHSFSSLNLLRLFGLPSFISFAADGRERDRARERNKITPADRLVSRHLGEGDGGKAEWRSKVRVKWIRRNTKKKKGAQRWKANERRVQRTLRGGGYKVNKQLSGETRLRLDVQLPRLSPTWKMCSFPFPITSLRFISITLARSLVTANCSTKQLQWHFKGIQKRVWWYSNVVSF